MTSGSDTVSDGVGSGVGIDVGGAGVSGGEAGGVPDDGGCEESVLEDVIGSVPAEVLIKPLVQF